MGISLEEYLGSTKHLPKIEMRICAVAWRQRIPCHKAEAPLMGIVLLSQSSPVT